MSGLNLSPAEVERLAGTVWRLMHGLPANSKQRPGIEEGERAQEAVTALLADPAVGGAMERATHDAWARGHLAAVSQMREAMNAPSEPWICMVERVRRGIVTSTDPVSASLEAAWRAGAEAGRAACERIAQRHCTDEDEAPVDSLARVWEEIAALPLPPYPGGERES